MKGIPEVQSEDSRSDRNFEDYKMEKKGDAVLTPDEMDSKKSLEDF